MTFTQETTSVHQPAKQKVQLKGTEKNNNERKLRERIKSSITRQRLPLIINAEDVHYNDVTKQNLQREKRRTTGYIDQYKRSNQ